MHLPNFSKTFKDFGLHAHSITFDQLETNHMVERNYNVKVLQVEVAMAIVSLNDG